MSLVEQQQYRTLRALKTLLPLSPEEIIDKILEGQGESSVSPSLILLHLFSGAPLELPSPHQVNRFSNTKLFFINKIIIHSVRGEQVLYSLQSAGWSIGRLSQWMDSHPSERDRLALCSGPLERYQLTVRQQNLPSFHPIFPQMMKLANLKEHSG